MSLTEAEIDAILLDKKRAANRRYAARYRSANKDAINAAKRAAYAADPRRVLAGQQKRQEGINRRKRDRYASDPSYREAQIERVRCKRGLTCVADVVSGVGE